MSEAHFPDHDARQGHELRRTADGFRGICTCGGWRSGLARGSEVVAAYEQHVADQGTESATPILRELTVGQLIERLQGMPSHRYVSPMVDGVLGVGIEVWQMFDPQTNDTIVVFGESKPQPPVIVPPDWTRALPPGSGRA